MQFFSSPIVTKFEGAQKKNAALCHKVSPLFVTASLEEEQLVSPESISPEMAIDPMKTHLTETLTH